MVCGTSSVIINISENIFFRAHDALRMPR